MADFQFYLNRQGVRGAKGVKGDKGDSPIVSVNKHTANEYVLQIDNPDGTRIITPNLVGQQIVVNTAGDYVKYDRDSNQFVTVELPSATGEEEGLIRLATDADYAERDEFSAVTPYGLVQHLPSLITTSVDNLIRVFYDEPTDSVVIDTSKINSDISAAAATATEALTASQNNTNEINVLKSTISGISGDYVTLDTAQTISSTKVFAGTVTFNATVNFGTSAYIFSDPSGLSIYGYKELNIHWGEAPNSSVARFNNNGCAWYTEQFDVQGKLSVKGSPAIVQRNLIAGENIKLEKDSVTGNVTISAAGGGGDVTAAGDNRFTGDNTFTGKVNISGAALTVEGLATLNQATAQYLNAVSITSAGEINAVSIKANGLRSDDIQTTENKKYLTEVDVDNQTIQIVNGKLHANLGEISGEVSDVSARVTTLENQVGDISAVLDSINGEVI